MKMNRRVFLSSISAGMLLPNLLWGGERRNDMFISSAKSSTGEYIVASFTRSGHKKYTFSLPDRAHAIALHPKRREGVIFGRRPETFFTVFAIGTGRVLHQRHCGKDRHFYGHGKYSHDGCLLFSTEKNKKTGIGVIGIWDTKDAYKKVAEIEAGGIGPHELGILPDGNTAVVAIGGIQTKGRKKVNIATMQPSLNYVDLRTGKTLSKYTLPQTLHKLSIRHLDVTNSGTVAFACQDQGTRVPLASLTGFHTGNDVLALAPTPQNVLTAQEKYCGSVVCDSTGRFTAISSPRGNTVIIWNTGEKKVVDSITFDDTCGIAKTSREGEFIFSSGLGGCMQYNAITGEKTFIDTPFTLKNQWDNHMIGVL